MWCYETPEGSLVWSRTLVGIDVKRKLAKHPCQGFRFGYFTEKGDTRCS